MREVVDCVRQKKIYQFSNIEEFEKGDWIQNLIPKDVISYDFQFFSNDLKLVVKSFKAKQIDGVKPGDKQNGNSREERRNTAK